MPKTQHRDSFPKLMAFWIYPLRDIYIYAPSSTFSLQAFHSFHYTHTQVHSFCTCVYLQSYIYEDNLLHSSGNNSLSRARAGAQAQAGWMVTNIISETSVRSAFLSYLRSPIWSRRATCYEPDGESRRAHRLCCPILFPRSLQPLKFIVAGKYGSYMRSAIECSGQGRGADPADVLFECFNIFDSVDQLQFRLSGRRPRRERLH